MASRKGRKELMLNEHINVIKFAIKNQKLCSPSVASVFKCGKRQIQKILQRKDELMAAYQANHSESRKRKHPSKVDDIDEAVYQWYSIARKRQV